MVYSGRGYTYPTRHLSTKSAKEKWQKVVFFISKSFKMSILYCKFSKQDLLSEAQYSQTFRSSHPNKFTCCFPKFDKCLLWAELSNPLLDYDFESRFDSAKRYTFYSRFKGCLGPTIIFCYRWISDIFNVGNKEKLIKRLRNSFCCIYLYWRIRYSGVWLYDLGNKKTDQLPESIFQPILNQFWKTT